MGANQSKPSDAVIHEKLIERLQALQIKDEVCLNEKDGYVCVENSSCKRSRIHKQAVLIIPKD
jgi:bleomycin hydrolase